LTLLSHTASVSRNYSAIIPLKDFFSYKLIHAVITDSNIK
jgi:hypothetical protein